MKSIAVLKAGIGASAFIVDFQRLHEWKPALNCARWLSLSQNGIERVRVDLDGPRRWIAFRRRLDGEEVACIGYQETVGAFRRGDAIIGGSNRKVLAWLHESGCVHIGNLED